MSALSLRYPYKPNTLADDLESFIHVVTYLGLRFHRHSNTDPRTIWACNGAPFSEDLVKQNAANETL